MDKQNVVYTYNEVLVNIKKEGKPETPTTWINFENMMLSEMRQMQKNKCCMISYTLGSRTGKFSETWSRIEVTWDWEDEELLFDGYRILVWEDKKIWKWIVVMVAQQCEFTWCLWTYMLKNVPF